MYRKIQRMTAPRYLQILTMTELSQTTYEKISSTTELCRWFAADAEKTHGDGRYRQSCGAGSEPLLEKGPADPDLESGTHVKRDV